VVWTFFEGETAQCHLEISIVFYFEMFQLNHTYRNGLVSSERHILIVTLTFPQTGTILVYDIDLLRQYLQA